MTRERSRRRPELPARPAPDAPPPEHFLLGLQRSAGNAAVSGLLAREPAVHTDTAHGDLYDWEVTDELARVGGYRLDELSVRTLQAALKTPETGAFSAEDVRAIAHVRKAHGLSRDAVIDGPLLNVVVHFCAHHHMQDDAIHLVVAYHGLDLSDTLAVRFNPAQMIPMATTFESTGSRRIALGPTATDSHADIVRAVTAALAEPVPSAGAPPAAGSPVLADWTAAAAAEFDAARVTDPRALRGIQQALRVPHTGVFDDDTVQAIGRLQTATGLPAVDGKVDEATLDALVDALAAARAEDSAIRLVIDYKRIPDAGVVAAEIDFALPAGEEFALGGAASRTRDAIRFAPALFALPAAHVVLTIEKAFEALRLSGSAFDAAQRDFLLARFAVLDQGNTPDDFHLFMVEVAQVARIWPTLEKEQRAGFANDLTAIQAKVRERWAAAPPAQQPTWQGTYDDVLALGPPVVY